MTPVETAIGTYLQRMREIRGTGGATSETSYYSALENLLNDLGKLLDPAVICNGQLKSTGVGTRSRHQRLQLVADLGAAGVGRLIATGGTTGTDAGRLDSCTAVDS